MSLTVLSVSLSSIKDQSYGCVFSRSIVDQSYGFVSSRSVMNES